MVRSVETVEKPSNVIEVDPGPETHPTGPHPKRRRPPNRPCRIKSSPDRIIDDRLERTPRAAHCVMQTNHDVIFEGEGRALRHVMKPITRAS